MDLGQMMIALPAPPSRDYGNGLNGSANNCNSRWGELQPLLTQAIGNYTTWRTYIDQDLPQTREILKLFGTVTELAPVVR